MKDKILFFIQSVYDLGLANSIKEKLDCDLYALIDFNKYIKKFYQKQQLVKFQKIWFFRDYILKVNRKPDVEYLSSFEKKYNINLWHIAYMDRNFYNFNEYYKFSHDEILLVLEQECKLFEQILEEVNPDFIINYMPDYNHSELFFELCKAKGIKILMFNHLGRLGHRCYISEGPDRLDNYNEIIKAYSGHSEKTIDELYNYYKRYYKQTTITQTQMRTSAWKKFISSLRYLLVVCNNEYRQYHVNYGRTRLRILINESSSFFKKLYRTRFISKNLQRDIEKGEPFIYFPLHLTPEQATLMLAPFYADQLNVIKNIARSIPAEYKLYVKEHPVQVVGNWRPISFYKSLLDMPNVKLLHPSVSNDELLKNCSLVITITGTLGLEAAFYKKPTIVFVDTLYSNLPSVYRVKSLEELPQAIRTSLKKEVHASDLIKFVNCIIDNSFDYDYIKIERAMDDRFFNGGFYYDIELPESEFMSFLKENNSIFDLLSSEFIKKINEHKKSQSKIIS